MITWLLLHEPAGGLAMTHTGEGAKGFDCFLRTGTNVLMLMILSSLLLALFWTAVELQVLHVKVSQQNG